MSMDSTVSSAIIPVPRKEKPTIASIEYDLIFNNPYKYTEEEVQFLTYIIKNPQHEEQLEKAREQFSRKSRACFRASPLVKNYGWGVHYDKDGKVSIYEVNSHKYNELLKSEHITVKNGMRTKREKGE